MSTLKTANIQDTSGNNNSTPQQISQGRAKAWVNFNGVTDTINNHFNVASITDVSAGIKTVTFSTAMPNANYCVVTDCHSYQTNRNQYSMVGGLNENNPSTTSFDVVTLGSTNSSVYDAEITFAAVFGD